MLLTGIAGMVAQLVDGVLGMGYGVSAATLLVAFGIAPAVVSATVHAAELPTAAVSGLAHLREGNVERQIVLPLAAGGIVGGVIGALALAQTAAGNVKPLVALVLLGLGVRMVYASVKGRSAKQQSTRLSAPRLILIGLLGGSLDAFGGGGWGPTCTSVLMTTDGREPRRLIGSVNLAEVATTAAIVLTFAVTVGSDTFAFRTALPLFVGGIVVAPFAARICARVDARVLAAGVGTALIALNSSTLVGVLGIDWLRPALWAVAALAAATVAAVALKQQFSPGVEA